MKNTIVAATAAAILLTVTSGCSGADSPTDAPAQGSPSVDEVSSPVHELGDRRLLVLPGLGDGDVMMAKVGGRLSLNENDCFALGGGHVLIVNANSTILPDATGIRVPEIGDVEIGESVRGIGGYLKSSNVPFADDCAEGTEPKFVVLSAS